MTRWWELHVCEGCGGKERLGHACGLSMLPMAFCWRLQPASSLFLCDFQAIFL